MLPSQSVLIIAVHTVLGRQQSEAAGFLGAKKMQVLHLLYEFLGLCSGAVEVSLLLGCVATLHWVISDRRFKTG
jgi:hypothetical protein